MDLEYQKTTHTCQIKGSNIKILSFHKQQFWLKTISIIQYIIPIEHCIYYMLSEGTYLNQISRTLFLTTVKPP